MNPIQIEIQSAEMINRARASEKQVQELKEFIEEVDDAVQSKQET